MPNRRSREEGPIGIAMARTWALVYRSAWITAEDVMDPPGIFCEYATFQSCRRAMERAGILLEDQPYMDRSKLYRLNPATVEALLGV